MFNVQDYSILYNDAVRMHIWQGWHLIHMLKPLAWEHHFTKSATFIEMPVLSQENERVVIYKKVIK
jgi:hypothetical protein